MASIPTSTPVKTSRAKLRRPSSWQSEVSKPEGAIKTEVVDLAEDSGVGVTPRGKVAAVVDTGSRKNVVGPHAVVDLTQEEDEVFEPESKKTSDESKKTSDDYNLQHIWNSDEEEERARSEVCGKCAR